MVEPLRGMAALIDKKPDLDFSNVRLSKKPIPLYSSPER
jgi:hypothetical protein